MSSPDSVLQHFHDLQKTLEQSMESLPDALVKAGESLAQCLLMGGKVLVCGNGGSAAESIHLTSELVNKFDRDRPGMPAIALTADTATITSIGNDINFNQIFARQVSTLGDEGDTLVLFTTSGNSTNIVEAAKAAQNSNMQIIAFSGREGGQLSEIMNEHDHELLVATNSTARIQEIHLLLLHCLCDYLDERIFGG